MLPNPLAWCRRFRESCSASTSVNRNCVEVAIRDRIIVRDTKDRTGPVLRFTPEAWREFARQIKAGVRS